MPRFAARRGRIGGPSGAGAGSAGSGHLRAQQGSRPGPAARHSRSPPGHALRNNRLVGASGRYSHSGGGTAGLFSTHRAAGIRDACRQAADAAHSGLQVAGVLMVCTTTARVVARVSIWCWGIARRLVLHLLHRRSRQQRPCDQGSSATKGIPPQQPQTSNTDGASLAYSWLGRLADDASTAASPGSTRSSLASSALQSQSAEHVRGVPGSACRM